MAFTRIQEFTYRKDLTEPGKKHKIFVLNRPSEFLEGISLEGLSADEIEGLQAASAAFEAAVTPFFKTSYRRFKPANIVKDPN